MPLSPGVARSAARRSLIAALSLAALAALAPGLDRRAVGLGEEGPPWRDQQFRPGSRNPRIDRSAKPRSKRKRAKSSKAKAKPARSGRRASSALARSPRPTPRSRSKRVIAAANRIRTLPYIWGGGHGRWQDSGYDCSGSVSYALHGARMLTSPLTSGSFETWGEAGAGPLDHDLRQRLARLHGRRRAAVRHRGRHQRDRTPLAPDHRRGGKRTLHRPPPDRLLAEARRPPKEKGRPQGRPFSQLGADQIRRLFCSSSR